MIVYMKKVPDNEKQIIEQLFYELQFVNSYYTTLQLLYNNSDHFSTISADKNLCTYQLLNHLGYISQNENYTIYIEGTIHSNYHISNVLFDKYTNRPLFVKDTYIRFSYDNINFMHLLVTPPNIEGEINDYIYHNESFENGICDLPNSSFIEPIFNNQYMGGIKNKYTKTKTYRVNKIKKYKFKKTKKNIKNRSSKKTINNRKKSFD